MKQPLLSLLLFVCIVSGRAFAPPVGVSNAVRPTPLVLGVSSLPNMPENNEDKNTDNNIAESSNNDGILTELGAKAGAMTIVAFIAVQGGSAVIHFVGYVFSALGGKCIIYICRCRYWLLLMALHITRTHKCFFLR